MKPIFRSILPPSIVGIAWFFGGKELILTSVPAALILIGIILIGFANIGRKLFNKKS